MHSDLSSHLHSPECNALIDALKKCHQEHKFLKFIGHCNEINHAMLKCLGKEMKIKVPRIEEETSAWERRPYLERYYKKRYILEKDGGSYCVLIHSNRMLVLTLAPSHPIFQENLIISSVNFQVSPTLNRLDNKVSGKKKRGGQYLSETSNICEINCENSRSFKVRAGTVGKLIEVNQNLIHNPEMLKNSSQGYIAIIGPRLFDLATKLGNLLEEDPLL